MSKSKAVPLFLLLCFLCSKIFSRAHALICNEKEKQALLSFKRSLLDPENHLSSWSIEEDCCEWEGIHCHNVTGRVVKLNLTNLGLEGEITPPLLKLEVLNHLDLSFNDFKRSPIPNFLGSMESLRYLDLSYANLVGLIPHQLGNISNLRHLNLGSNGGLYVEDLSWVSLLASLEYLNMEWVDLHREAHWLESMAMLPSLSELYLPGCQLHGNMISSVGYANFTSLTFLDLSENNLNQEIPDWLFNLTGTLSNLVLSWNQFIGEIPESIGQFKYLKYLDLSWNSFSGHIPSSMGNLSSLINLNLEGNRLNGTLPRSLGLLSKLFSLLIGYNSLTGDVSEVHFTTVSNLNNLDLGFSSVSFSVRSNWIPPFQLQYLWLSSCKVGPKFPLWLQTQNSLLFLDLSRSGIEDTAPTWFWKLAPRIDQIHLSGNRISGDISEVVLNNTIIDLSSNWFTGRLPRLSSNIVQFTIANNSFSGRISPFICQKMNGIAKLEVLDVSKNALSGELSDCWMNWQSLTHVNLGSNNLSGQIPNSVGSLYALKALNLHNNSFHGYLPSLLANCKSLGLINLSVNKFSGRIPRWMVERTTLIILHLRSNNFFGNIPPQICQLSSLIVLDLADNSLSGTIPKCLNNISTMAAPPSQDKDDSRPDALEASYDYESYMENLILNIKGRESEYTEILPYVRMIDLSSNNLSGSIPTEVSDLSGLQFLNFSRNHLVGNIPEKIGHMKSLESLDLSRNHLSGQIPQSMTNLTFLDYLNLSYNNFSGRIPSSTQLQSFDELNFFGNVGLCGAPLEKNCTEDEETRDMSLVEESEGGHEISWFYTGMGPGFIVGFWGVCGALFFRRAWRHAYFQFLNDMREWFAVRVAIKLKWFPHNFR